jgi:hypothetical protein
VRDGSSVGNGVHSSCPGLTRASIGKKIPQAKKMDCRVKPGNDRDGLGADA